MAEATIRHATLERLHAMFGEIDRLTTGFAPVDWTERDILLAQSALCHVAAFLAIDAAARSAKGETDG